MLSLFLKVLSGCLKNQAKQYPEPVGGDAGAESSDGVGADGFADEFAVTQGVEHGGVGGEVSAPAHTHSREDGNGVVVDDAGGIEGGHQADGCAYGTQRGDGKPTRAPFSKPKSQ